MSLYSDSCRYTKKFSAKLGNSSYLVSRHLATPRDVAPHRSTSHYVARPHIKKKRNLLIGTQLTKKKRKNLNGTFKLLIDNYKNENDIKKYFELEQFR